MKVKHLWFLFISLFLVVLVACSNGEEDASTNEDSTGDTNTSLTTDENAEDTNDEVVTLVYARGADSTNATDKIVEEFNKLHPNIQVEFREMPADTGQQHDAYVTMFNAGSSEIDVMDLDVIWPAEFAQAGYVLELDRFIQQEGMDLNAYNQGALSASQYNGKQWALPKFIDTGLLFYRTDIISEDQVPTTWDELLTLAKDNQGAAGNEFGYLMQAKQYEGLVCNAVEFIASYGGSFLDENGEVVVNSPETIKGLQKLVEFATADFVPGNVTTFAEPESHTAFIEGQSAFIRNWPYQWNLANDENESSIVGNVGVAPLPAGDAGSAAALGGWQTAINKHSEHKQEAFEFLKFMTGPEGQKLSAIHGGLAPTLPELFEDEEILEANPFFAEEGFVEGLNAAVSRPVAPNYPEVSEIIQINVSKAIAGEMTVEEAVESMEKELTAVMQ
ncbi:ABC transporter substrate-binding protein [Pontibacillus halophilus JSM 076056 = DSM 19796]|uniref:ABC transporter substrate-binding protein n=1 Tax=Pontibacillus halophilus JSM 076056 = DSM 19796 TaxID=1385510 RepID=A0A0A5GLJ9_9BACI|nr:ABC transporter substrate-binding protein [Pontibacillus halophilus]KGX92098.1 ABC transporter substrate-binding protein [Pontibacillus halophilus JSM 076056 = DSM 19796]